MNRNKLRTAIRNIVKDELWRKNINEPSGINNVYAGSHPEENYMQGNEYNLGISDDTESLIVEPDVRKKIRDYYKKMKMIP